MENHSSSGSFLGEEKGQCFLNEADANNKDYPPRKKGGKDSGIYYCYGLDTVNHA
jgi:hypothetical protein